jgi:hypothetical protein
VTFDEYLEIDSKAEFKSEFVSRYNSPQDTIHLAAINCNLSLAEVYRMVPAAEIK